MAAVFQPNVFQNTVFQTNGGPPPVVPVTGGITSVGGGGKAGVDLDELEVFCKLKRLMEKGKSLIQAMALLDIEEAEEVTEALPKKITAKMQKRPVDPTVIAWINHRIITLERQVADIEDDEEQAVITLLCHLT